MSGVMRIVVTALLLLFSSALLAPLTVRAAYPLPPYPVIFIHGINSGPDTWSDMKSRLCGNSSVVTPCISGSGGWKFGGTPIFDPSMAQVHGEDTALYKNGDFYTLKFSDNYNLSLSQQGFELDFIIKHVKKLTGASKVILVAHSMGGLAARSYLQNMASDRIRFPLVSTPYSGDVAQLITVGTPHKGSTWAKLEQIYKGCWGYPFTPETPCLGAYDLSSDPLSLALGVLASGLADPNHGLPTSVTY